MSEKRIVTGVRPLMQSEAKRFISEGTIKEGGTFWTKDGGYSFGGECRGGVVINEGKGQEVGTCDARAGKVGVRPAITLSTGDATQGVQVGDIYRFTSPDKKETVDFIFNGVSEDNKFIATCTRNLTEMAFSEGGYEGHEYDKSNIKAVMDNINVNIQKWECERVPIQEINKDTDIEQDDDGREL